MHKVSCLLIRPLLVVPAGWRQNIFHKEVD